MSLQSFIENISQKPEHIRKRYSFFISFGITAIIFVFWISSFSFPSYYNEQVLTDVMDKVDTPGQSLVASVGSLFTDIKDIVFGPKKVIYSSIEVTPGRK
jgi:hypothetical protein